MTNPPSTPEHPATDASVVAGALPMVDRLLDDLPAEFCVACQGVLRLAIGPTGVFVLSSDRARAADDGELLHPEIVGFMLAKAAADTREALADHLSWVPFVDALFAVEQAGPTPTAVTAVPIDLLRSTLVEGRSTVAAVQLAAVRQLLRDDMLKPWAFCLPGQAMIDLSDSARNALPRS